jgi:hypothetical protein
MCLIDKKRFRFTFKPIICYKYFKIENGQLKNFYRGNSIKSSTMWANFGFAHRINRNEVEFGKGFIHALTKHPQYPVIYTLRCIIPPFTRYAIGENGDICARRMKIIEENNYVSVQ